MRSKARAWGFFCGWRSRSTINRRGCRGPEPPVASWRRAANESASTAPGPNQKRNRTFLSACEGFDSSVIATVEPASVPRRVLYTFADVPLNARRLVVSQIASTTRQEHQRRSQERGFDDGEHARDPPLCPQKMDDGPQKAGESMTLPHAIGEYPHIQAPLGPGRERLIDIGPATEVQPELASPEALSAPAALPLAPVDRSMAGLAGILACPDRRRIGSV